MAIALESVPRQRRSAWNWIVLIVWKLFSFAILSVVYWTMISEGLRHLVSPLGQKLYRVPLPGFSFMQNEMTLRRLDLAHCIAILLLLATYALANENLRIILRSDHSIGRGFNPAVYVKFVQLMGLTIIGIDAVLFYMAMSQMSGWGGSRFSVTTLLATVLYVGVLLFTSFMTVNLERKEN